MDEMGTALADATNGVGASNGTGAVAIELTDEQRQKADGWKSNVEKYKKIDGEDSEVIVTVSTAPRYEWQDDFGDVVPRVESLERELYHSQFLNRQGSHFGT